MAKSDKTQRSIAASHFTAVACVCNGWRLVPFCVCSFPRRVIQLSLVTLLNTMMALGLISWYRALIMSAGTLQGTVAHMEAERAVGFAMLLCVLTAPWLVIVAIIELLS